MVRYPPIPRRTHPPACANAPQSLSEKPPRSLTQSPLPPDPDCPPPTTPTDFRTLGENNTLHRILTGKGRIDPAITRCNSRTVLHEHKEVCLHDNPVTITAQTKRAAKQTPQPFVVTFLWIVLLSRLRRHDRYLVHTLNCHAVVCCAF